RVERQEVPPPAEPRVRLLGAIVPHERETWFFKLVGKIDAVEPFRTPFEDFVRSVRFDGPGDIAWKLPDGWERLPEENPNRYATLRVGPKDAALELSVTRLGDEDQTRSKRANVIRWARNDVGIKVHLEDLGEYARDDHTAEGGLAI